MPRKKPDPNSLAPIPSDDSDLIERTAQLRGRNGRPRRGKELAKSTTVRVNDETRECLTREFGSLGNALYFLHQGIQEKRRFHEIPAVDTDFDTAKLFRDDLENIYVALFYYAKNGCNDGKHARPYKGLALKIAKYLYGELPTDDDRDEFGD